MAFTRRLELEGNDLIIMINDPFYQPFMLMRNSRIARQGACPHRHHPSNVIANMQKKNQPRLPSYHRLRLRPLLVTNGAVFMLSLSELFLKYIQHICA